jgi:hypothetical protein
MANGSNRPNVDLDDPREIVDKTPVGLPRGPRASGRRAAGGGAKPAEAPGGAAAAGRAAGAAAGAAAARPAAPRAPGPPPLRAGAPSSCRPPLPRRPPSHTRRPSSSPSPPKTQFPDPKLYFKVFDSERDEPETKYREDVNKLYDRWLKKYGRKWPENGLNTDDLVWLYEEAYKDEADALNAAVATDGGRLPRGGSAGGAGGGAGGSGAGGRRGGRPGPGRRVANEREDIPGELMEDSDEALAAAAAKLPKDPKARAAALARAKEEVANATWVTDEFESSEYERGNLEAVHDLYLWDREGKTTIMPNGGRGGVWGFRGFRGWA